MLIRRRMEWISTGIESGEVLQFSGSYQQSSAGMKPVMKLRKYWDALTAMLVAVVESFETQQVQVSKCCRLYHHVTLTHPVFHSW